jgi:YgiT-type zinc finger domain-containing protein
MDVEDLIVAIRKSQVRITDHADEEEAAEDDLTFLETKQVEKLLRGGGNTVSLKVAAEVCQRCGERLYTEDIVRSFEEIRTKLRKQEFAHLKPLGQSFTVDSDWPNKAIQPTV